MIQAPIYIHGNIGSYTDPSGKEVKGVELLDVIAQVQSHPGSKSFLAYIGSPGGLVDAGNQIYDYLESLKAQGIQVDTISDSYVDAATGESRQGVGSIATKIFLAGQNRTIIEGHEFFIHNPWTQPQPGDSNKIAVELQGLKQTENELRSFYQQKTKITDVGLKGLMDVETGMNADQAVALGFATKKMKAVKVRAFALHKSTIDMTKNLTPGQKFAQQIGAVLDQVLGTKSAIKAMVLEGDKGKISVDVEDPAALVGATVVTVDEAGTPTGQPAPDGEHKLTDGRILVVAGGKVTEVKAPAAAAATPAATTGTSAPAAAAVDTAALQAKITALEQANAKQAEELNALKAVDVNAQITAAVTELKNSLVSGKAPVKAHNNQGNAGKEKELSPIQLAMKK